MNKEMSDDISGGTSFNLLFEPWIDVVKKDGTTSSTGLYDLFQNAHEISDLQVCQFHGITFYYYEYILMRLLCSILVDAYRNECDCRVLLGSQKFDLHEGSPLSEYFRKYEDRFDLFDDVHPFLQSGSHERSLFEKSGVEIKTDEKSLLAINPCAPAASARVGELRIEDVESFKKYVNNPDSGTLYSAIPVGVTPAELIHALAKSYRITPKEWAYIVLYHSCANTGYEAGKSAGLIGTGFLAETLAGRNLFETIVLNSASLLAGNGPFGKPQWRWDFQMEAFQDEMDFGRLTGMFFPSKYLFSTFMSDGSVEIASRMLSKSEKDVVKAYRDRWALDLEPHIVPVSETRLYKKDGTRNSAGVYQKAGLHEISWFRILGATQTDTKRLTEDDLKELSETLAFASHNTRSFADTTNEDDPAVHIRTYYRIMSDKWVYQATGKIEGVVPAKMYGNSEAQAAIRRMASFILKACDTEERCIREYLRPNVLSPVSSNNRFEGWLNAGECLGRMTECIMGLNGEKEGFLYKAALSDADTIPDLFEEFADTVVAKAEDLFESYFRQDRVMEFYRVAGKMCYILKKEGEKYYG